MQAQQQPQASGLALNNNQLDSNDDSAEQDDDDQDSEALLYKMMQQQGFLTGSIWQQQQPQPQQQQPQQQLKQLQPSTNEQQQQQQQTSGQARAVDSTLQAAAQSLQPPTEDDEMAAAARGAGSGKSRKVIKLLKSYSHIHQVDDSDDQIRGTYTRVQPNRLVSDMNGASWQQSRPSNKAAKEQYNRNRWVLPKNFYHIFPSISNCSVCVSNCP